MNATAHRRAETGSVIQPDEALLAEVAAERGVELVPQFPVGGYNLDFCAFGSVAVEVQSFAGHPMRTPQTAHRIERLVNAGWHVVYLWRPERAGCHEVITFAEEAHRDVSGRGQCRVIRGTGEDATIGESDLREAASHWATVTGGYVLPRPGEAR